MAAGCNAPSPHAAAGSASTARGVTVDASEATGTAMDLNPSSATMEQGASNVKEQHGTAFYRCDPVGRWKRNSKLRHAWTLSLPGESSETKIELLHSRLTGKKQVLMNGKVMHSTRERCLNWRWQHPPTSCCIVLHSENGNHQLVVEDACASVGGGAIACPLEVAEIVAGVSSAATSVLRGSSGGESGVGISCGDKHLMPQFPENGPNSLATAARSPRSDIEEVSHSSVVESSRCGGLGSSGSSSTTLPPMDLGTLSTVPPEETIDLGSPVFWTRLDMPVVASEPPQMEAIPIIIPAPRELAEMDSPLLTPRSLQPQAVPRPRSWQQLPEPAADASSGSPPRISEEENQRLQALIEVRKVQIAALQGHLRQSEQELSASPFPQPAPYSRGMYSRAKEHLCAAIPPIATSPAGASTPASSSAALVPAVVVGDHRVAYREEVPIGHEGHTPALSSTLDDEQLDVTRRLGPDFVGGGERQHRCAVEVKVELVPVEVCCKPRAGSTPPVVLPRPRDGSLTPPMANLNACPHTAASGRSSSMPRSSRPLRGECLPPPAAGIQPCRNLPCSSPARQRPSTPASACRPSPIAFVPARAPPPPQSLPSGSQAAGTPVRARSVTPVPIQAQRASTPGPPQRIAVPVQGTGCGGSARLPPPASSVAAPGGGSMRLTGPANVVTPNGNFTYGGSTRLPGPSSSPAPAWQVSSTPQNPAGQCWPSPQRGAHQPTAVPPPAACSAIPAAPCPRNPGISSGSHQRYPSPRGPQRLAAAAPWPAHAATAFGGGFLVASGIASPCFIAPCQAPVR